MSFFTFLRSGSRDHPNNPIIIRLISNTLISLRAQTNLSELHDEVHEAAGGAVRLLCRAHGRLQQVLDGDLVLQSLVQEPLSARQLARRQDLDLEKMVR